MIRRLSVKKKMIRRLNGVTLLSHTMEVPNGGARGVYWDLRTLIKSTQFNANHCYLAA